MLKSRFPAVIIAAILAQVLSAAEPPVPRFTSFSYTGCDDRFNVAIDDDRQYLNPVLSGFFPDPSVCRKGEDYFLVNSTFSYFPGVPIFHSRDLVNWTQLGFVLDKPSQLSLDGIRLSGGVYAPAISYNPFNDTFYMVTTIVDGIGNCYVKTKDPFAGEWSDPVCLPQVNGIDPSFHFDEDGKAYVVYNGDCPGEPEWDGHRAIWMYEFDYGNDCVKGEKVLLVDGGVNKADKPVWIEGPHLYRVDGKYLLMCAEGGTGTWHSEVIFTSDSPYGPFVPHACNPVLTQRDLPEDRPDKVTSTGHADLIQAPDGGWWAVFLGCRPYEGDLYNTGRETFLLPVRWEDGIPVILPKGESVPVVAEKPGLMPGSGLQPKGNFSWTDRFETLDHKWMQVRTPSETWWKTGKGLEITPRKVTLDMPGCNPSFMAVRQQHMAFEAETVMDYAPQGNVLAGLAVFQNESNNYVIGKRNLDGRPCVVLYRTDGDSGFSLVASEVLTAKDNGRPMRFKVVADGADYRFMYAAGRSRKWKQLGNIQDGRILSTNRAGGFTGTMIGCYATSASELSENR